MNFYKRHIGDYLRDAGHLTLLEHGVYTRLLDVYYTREGAIPSEQAARLIGARTRDERDAVDRVLAEFFELADDAWRQRRCEREIEAATTKAERNREIGKRGGRPRKTETQTVSETQTETEPRNNPDGFHEEPKQNPSQTPDTRLQTPEKAGKRESRSPSGSRIPDGFPGETELAYCRETRPDLPAETVAQVFRDHWLGKPGKDGRKIDWPATWRVWVARERSYTRNAGPGPRGRETTEEHNRRAFAQFLGEPFDDGRTIDA